MSKSVAILLLNDRAYRVRELETLAIECIERGEYSMAAAHIKRLIKERKTYAPQGETDD